MSGLQQRMKADLTAALRERDRPAIATLRTALAAVSNAEAVPASTDYREPVLGRSYEVARRELTEEQIAAILCAEADERRAAIDEYESLGVAPAAGRLRAELDVLNRYLGQAAETASVTKAATPVITPMRDPSPLVDDA